MAEDLKVKLWQRRIEIALKKRDKHFEKWASIFVKSYAGKSSSNEFAKEKYAKFANRIYTIEESIEGAMIYKNPEIVAESLNPDYTDNEAVVAAIMNVLYDRKLHMETINRRIHLDARLCGYGVGVCFNKFVFDEVIDTEAIKGGQSIVNSIVDNVKTMLGKEKPAPEGKIVPKEDNIYYERVQPQDILFDWTKDFGKGWKIKIRREKIVDVWRSQEFNENKTKLDPSKYELGGIQDVVNPMEDDKYKNEPDFRYKTLYEIHDFENNRLLILPKDENFFIKDEEYPYSKELINVFYIADDPSEDGFYPIIPVANYYNQAMELNYLDSLLEKWLDISRPRYGVNYNALADKRSKQDIQSGKIGTVITFKAPITGNIQKFGGESIGQDFYNYYQLQEKNLMQQSGKTDYDLGQPSQSRKATETQYMQQGVMARTYRSDKQFYHFIISQIETIREVARREMTERFYVKVKGNEGLDWYKEDIEGEGKPVDVGRERLEGDYRFKFDLASMRRADPLIEIEQGLKYAQLLTLPQFQQAIAQDGQRITLTEFAKKLLEKGGYHERIIIPTDMMSQEREIMMMLQTGNYIPPNPDEDHSQHLRVIEEFKGSPMFKFLDEQAEAAQDPETQFRIAGGMEGLMRHEEETRALQQEKYGRKQDKLETKIERPSSIGLQTQAVM